MSAATFERRRAAGAPIALAAWGMIAGALLQVVLGIPLASLQAQDPPPTAIPVALPGYAMNYAIGLWGVCWLLLGLALRAEAT